MTKMRTLKEKLPKSDEMESISILPTFSLKQSQIPEAKNWQVGKKYRLEIEVEMIGTSKDEWSKDKTIRHSFQIEKIGVEMSEEEMQKKRGNIY